MSQMYIFMDVCLGKMFSLTTNSFKKQIQFEIFKHVKRMLTRENWMNGKNVPQVSGKNEKVVLTFMID